MILNSLIKLINYLDNNIFVMSKGSERIFQFEKRGVPLVIVGLANAGKTTFVQRLQTGEFVETRTTLGVSFETVDVGDVRFDIFDLGGHEAYRKTLWDTYVKLAYGIVFILDAADSSSFDEAKREFWRCVRLKENSEEFLVLFLCNKIDIEGHASLETIINRMELFKLAEKSNCSYHFFLTSMKTGENVNHSVMWLKNQTAKLVSKKQITPKLVMITDINGLPLIELDSMDITEDPNLISGFLSAIESFGSQLFGKKSALHFIIVGDYKYVIKSDGKYIGAVIIPTNQSQEEARRLIGILLESINQESIEIKKLEKLVMETFKLDKSQFKIKYG